MAGRGSPAVHHPRDPAHVSAFRAANGEFELVGQLMAGMLKREPRQMSRLAKRSMIVSICEWLCAALTLQRRKLAPPGVAGGSIMFT